MFVLGLGGALPSIESFQETMDSHAETIEKQKERIRDLQTEREEASSAACTAKEQVKLTTNIISELGSTWGETRAVGANRLRAPMRYVAAHLGGSMCALACTI